jgi:hypothetical protein
LEPQIYQALKPLALKGPEIQLNSQRCYELAL